MKYSKGITMTDRASITIRTSVIVIGTFVFFESSILKNVARIIPSISQARLQIETGYDFDNGTFYQHYW